VVGLILAVMASPGWRPSSVFEAVCRSCFSFRTLHNAEETKPINNNDTTRHFPRLNAAESPRKGHTMQEVLDLAGIDASKLLLLRQLFATLGGAQESSSEAGQLPTAALDKLFGALGVKKPAVIAWQAFFTDKAQLTERSFNVAVALSCLGALTEDQVSPPVFQLRVAALVRAMRAQPLSPGLLMALSRSLSQSEAERLCQELQEDLEGCCEQLAGQGLTGLLELPVGILEDAALRGLVERCQECSDSEAWDRSFEEDPRQVLDSLEWKGPEDAPIAGEAGTLDWVPMSPIADMPSNSWCQGMGRDFVVRAVGSLKSKKKLPSLPSLYHCFGTDVYHSSKPIRNIGCKVQVPVLPFHVPSDVVPGIFIMNLQLPTYKEGKPYMMNKPKKGDGDCINAVMYFMIRRTVADELEDLENASPAVRLLEDYFRRAPEVQGNGADGRGDYRGRFKLIGRLHEGIPSTLSSFNGKPALVTHDGRIYPNGSNTVLDVNVNEWAWLARTSLHSFGGLHPSAKPGTGLFPSVKIFLGAVIESREEEHMPERILGCLQMSECDLKARMVEWTGALRDLSAMSPRSKQR